MTPSPKPADNEAEPKADNANAEPALPAEASKESQLEERIELLEQDNAKLRDQWMRAVAETDNVRKRSQRDQEETSRYAIGNFARDMVSVLENLKRASESIPPAD